MTAPTPPGPKSAARAYTHPGLPEPADKDYAVIGKSKPKIDGREKVTGQARYTADLKFPNMLYGKILTSPHAHARILSIDTSEAEKLPGVKAVITHKDVPTLKYGISPARWDENIFCIDKVQVRGRQGGRSRLHRRGDLLQGPQGDQGGIRGAARRPRPAARHGRGRAPDPRRVSPEQEHRDPPGLRRRGRGVPAGRLRAHRRLRRQPHLSGAAWNRIPPPPSGRTANSPSTPAPSRLTTSSTTSPASSDCPWATCASSRPTWAAASAASWSPPDSSSPERCSRASPGDR